ncbi:MULTISPECIES: OmpA family protein [Chryseobacterium]|uniref:OOP family OmpA-OmpF porin n=1 Tax=Chryseobacterium camelliae TaxID=1265445 RepID=A0ABU0TKW2_9FLAO|nr:MULTISPECIES: OmpA family protein [Chryseobacterium]MDT3408721.1 OOP family OmpA-OmpF porin [Pseudacidovorax intermedius]MDQ1097426.1 OOP family OmpA-OmpF porin [Chryseobacterium camelliae]MDQ1101354.1 OOP family OmpA-OmpF porin [Chryseobacterium sp. SORGH_AS_1048]MDR6084799.1 OOP family OmpA-OmpF porin [Chryseobacterium sp. SORGH_AS_0909]MDR6129146.1 OOP family OmpA-OmpF porin [Chryseobacterium sp. SORGH_AS_1175]
MKLSLAIVALAMAVPTASFAQDSTAVSNGQYPNTFTSGSANVSPFTNQSKRFNDWSISIGAGVPLVQGADLTSIKNGNGKNVFGYSAYVSIDKAITHAFGLKLQYDRGETRQGWFNTKDPVPTNVSPYEQVAARTQYDAISILGDINFSNLLRRVDNHSPYRWALHGYAGVGTLAYRAYQKDINGQRLATEVKPFKFGSMFGQAGAGLKFKVNRRLDIEGRVMYVVTGDDEFDGGGANYSAINQREEQTSDNFINATLGISLKLGKHESHLMWHDPLQEIYYKLDVLANKNQDIEVCKKGDADNDGVCDDWDRQLDTPAGARVDGAGVALDTDLDGVIDLYDKCVTVPGPVENNGCPTTAANNGPVVETETKLEGIEFDLNSDRILPSNTPILNNAVSYINSSNGSYNVIGATDTRASQAYNQKLSERRANNVKDYLIKNGVESSKLNAIGRGKKDLKYPECDPATKCPEWKNRANRRVYFEAK